jgi:hypothetical protein
MDDVRVMPGLKKKKLLGDVVWWPNSRRHYYRLLYRRIAWQYRPVQTVQTARDAIHSELSLRWQCL